MSLNEKLIRFKDKIDIRNLLPDYVFKKWIFRGALIIIVILFFVSWGLLNFSNPFDNHFYISCPNESNAICPNPFYDLCNPEGELFYTNNKICEGLSSEFYESNYLIAGEELGIAPNSLVAIIINNSWLLILVAFIVNHLLYNKGYFKGLGLEENKND